MTDTGQPLAMMTIRIPADLRDRIAEQAKKDRRSTNAQVIYLLEREFPDPASDGASS